MLFAFISFKNSRIPYSDPRVKPEDDIVGNSRIPRIILEFLRMNLEFLEIASLRSQ